MHERATHAHTSHLVAIRTILPSIFTSLTRIANGSDPLKLALNEISYKPFISLFNLTGAAAADPSVAAIVDYASVVALELHAAQGGGEPTVNMRFKNGTTDPTFHDLELFGSSQVGLSEFIGQLAVRVSRLVGSRLADERCSPPRSTTRNNGARRATRRVSVDARCSSSPKR